MPSELLVDLFHAYYDARKHKRKSAGAIRFELDYERELFKLHDEIVNGTYEISPSICFIAFSPVKREIFAGDFRDRIVHHLLFNYLNPFCERIFIADSYSCRKGKGTSFGIRRAVHFIRSASDNYQRDCFVLRLDISGYFMSIDKRILFEKVTQIVHRFESEIVFDCRLILFLIRKVIFNDPTKNCVMKGMRDDWIGLPRSKSLFFSKEGTGLPIGNLTSQLFSNVYLHDFDMFVRHTLGIRCYGRYVDDMFFVSHDKAFLATLPFVVNAYLRDALSLRIHPKKICLQPARNGVLFLGKMILPYRMYLKNATKGNLYRTIQKWTAVERQQGKLSLRQARSVRACLDSYRGMFASCNAHRLERKMIFCRFFKEMEFEPVL